MSELPKMQASEQPKDMREHNAWGLFSMQVVPGGFAVLVHDVPIIGPVTFGAAHEVFTHLIRKTVALDGNARALAIAWANAANESENARHVQARCTELLEEKRALKAKLREANNLIYGVKFALEQGISPATHDELLSKLVEALDRTSINVASNEELDRIAARP